MDGAGLIPKDTKKLVIVMENMTFHKRQDIVQAIEGQGYIIEWLPMGFIITINPFCFDALNGQQFTL